MGLERDRRVRRWIDGGREGGRDGRRNGDGNRAERERGREGEEL